MYVARSRRMPLRSLAAAALAVSILTPAWSGPPTAAAAATTDDRSGIDYRYVYIDTPGGHGRALGVSDDRTVVGYYLVNAVIEQPFVFTETGGTHTLPLDDGMRHGGANTISPDGKTIAGWEETPAGDCWAVSWTSATGGAWTVHQLVHDALANDPNEVGCRYTPVGVTDDGTIAINDISSYTGLVWSHGAATTVAGDPLAISTSGEAVGFQRATSNDSHQPWRASGGSIPLPAGATRGDVWGLASDGTVIVQTEHGAYQRQPDGHYVALDSLPGASSSFDENVRAINDHDEVVGDGTAGTLDGAEVPHGVRWNADGSATDLNDVMRHDGGETVLTARAVNKDGDIAVGASTNRSSGMEVPGLLVALPPIIFVPGVAGSFLVDSTLSPDPERWLGCTTDHNALALWPTPSTTITASDVLRNASCFGITDNVDLQGYGPLIAALKGQGGMVEYNENHDPVTRTTAGCDTTQRSRHPNLFLLPYDWRLSNAASAQKLADLMGCVRDFYTGPVMIVAHSMGGLVSRRYILDHPNDTHHVRELFTIGTPWLGAPKLVNAEETGEFVPTLLPSTVKTIVPTMPGPGQLLPSDDYYQLTDSPFVEDGWDINHDGTSQQAYTRQQVDALLDAQYAPFHADITRQAQDFHSFSTAEGSEDDWRTDNTDVHYTVMYGWRSINDTIGAVHAKHVTNCTTLVGITLRCTTRDYFEKSMVGGDATVPVESSSRINDDGSVNFNNADHERLLPVFDSYAGDDTTEHTGLTRNTYVQNTILETDGRVGDAARPNVTATAAAGGSTLQLSSAVKPMSVAGAQAAPSQPPQREQWNVDLQGFADTTTVTAPNGSNDAVVQGVYRPQLTDVTHAAEGDDAELDVLPADSGPYRIAFTAGSAPVRIDVHLQEGAEVESHTVWADLDVPAGHSAVLSLARSVASLTVDEDGDGTAESNVAPTFDPTGLTAAWDATPPTVTAGSIVLGGTREYTLAANDDSTGVEKLLWSVDGTTFQPYDGPIALPTGTAVLYAFADDKAGNRSELQEFGLSELEPGPLTTATFDPAPTESGWSKTPITVHLHARATDGTTITKLHWTAGWTSGEADGATATFTDSNTVSFLPLTYYATDSAGHDEAVHSVPLAVDSTPPTLTVSAPAQGSRAVRIGQVAGRASEDWSGSGVASTEVAIERDADGAYWTGTAWQPAPAWLSTQPGPEPWFGDWKLDASQLPSGDALTAGAYGIHVRSTDRADNVATANPVVVTVVGDAEIRSLEAPPGDYLGHPTAAHAINDAGQVTGTVQYYPNLDYETFPTRWDADGSATFLDGSWPPGSGNGINSFGEVAGNTRNQTAKWRADGTEVLLPPGPRGPYSSGWTAYDINDSSAVAGSDGFGNWAVWNGSVQTALPGMPPVAGLNTALGDVNGISNAGVVAGTGLVIRSGQANLPMALTDTPAGVSFLFPAADPSSMPLPSGVTGVERDGTLTGWGGVERAPGSAGYTINPPFVRTPDGTSTWIDLGAIDETCGTATGARNGIVVGYGGNCWWAGTDLGLSNSRAWVMRGGAVQDLTSLLPADSGWVLQQAYGVNASGQIVGTGTLNGKTKGFVFSLGALPSLDTAPSATDVSVSTDLDNAVPVTFAGTDAEHDSLTWSVAAGPAHGSVSPVSGDTVTYTPAAGFRGDDTFAVRASDGTYFSNTAIVTVRVGADAPPLPIAVITGPSYAGEGARIVLDGSDSIAPVAGETLQYSWDVNDDGVFGDATTPTVTVSRAGVGSARVRLRVTGSSGSDQTSTTVTFVNVAPAVTGVRDAVIQPGAAYDVTGGFSDPGTDEGWTATVDYGDGGGAQPLALHGTAFALHHVYAEVGAFPVTVTVCDVLGGCDTASARVAVARSDVITLTATGHDIAAVEGQPVTVPVATVTDSDAGATAGDLTATVSWGDGTGATPGTVTRDSAGRFTVTGTHTYADEGAFPVAIEIVSGDVSARTSATATVADAPLVATGLPGLTSPRTVTGLTVATFADGNPAAPVADFTATVDWGDGTAATAGTVVAADGGAFAVKGSHTYATDGPHTLTVHVADVGGSEASATSHVIVYGLAAGGSFVVGDGSAAGSAYFWGPQWALHNALSAGAAPSDFKGFAPGGELPACGAAWAATPGASTEPPVTVPDYLAVVVSDRVQRDGSTLSGVARNVVIVHVAPGYGRGPGQPGTGTVVATIC